MDCAEAREHLGDLNRGLLPASTADPVRAHAGACGGWRPWLPGPRWTVSSLAGATALVLLLGVGWLWMAMDPVSSLLDRAVDEQTEYVKDTMTRPAADPAAVMRELKRKVDYAFEPVFPGDAQQQLVAGKVSNLPGARAATFVYCGGPLPTPRPPRPPGESAGRARRPPGRRCGRIPRPVRRRRHPCGSAEC